MDKPTAAVETPPVTPSAEDEFASAFTEAIGADNPTTPDAPVVAPPDTPAEPAAEAAAAPEPVETPPPEPEAPAEPAAEAPEAQIARLEAENATLKAPKPAQAPQAPAASETAPQAPEGPSKGPSAPPEPVWYQPSDEEKTILSDLEKNWPDIATAQQVAIKQAVYNAVQYTFAQIQKTYNPALQRFAELSDVMAEQMALSALRGEHEDYDEIYDKVVGWVDTLPGPFKAGAKMTMAQGTPEEVAELISEYKKLHPSAASGATVTPAAAVPAARKTELSPAAKQAASRLRVVGSKRTTPVVAADPNDFNAAWDEAIASGS